MQVSDKPADEDHTYGHGKIENLSAFGEAGLMAVSCAWIIWEAMQRILVPHGGAAPLDVAGAGAVDFDRGGLLAVEAAARSGASGRGRRRWPPMHFILPSDIWSTVAVLCGLGASWVGTQFGDWLAALCGSVCGGGGFADDSAHDAAHLGRETVAVLMDEVPVETRRRLVHEVEQVEGVLAVEQARVRRAGAGYFADLTLALPRRFTFEHTGELVRAATEAAHRALPQADVVIHTVPREARAESVFDRVRAVAARNNVSVHELSVQSHHGRLRVEQHVELDENHAAQGGARVC